MPDVAQDDRSVFQFVQEVMLQHGNIVHSCCCSNLEGSTGMKCC